MERNTDTPDVDAFVRRARGHFRYDPATGFLHRRKPSGRWGTRGRVGSPNKSGHRQVRFEGVLYMEHRLSWLIVHGKWPVDELDHVNGVPDDNRMENLRECDHNQNMKNSKLRETNKSGHTGVWLNPANGKFLAYITADRKRKSLGHFDSLSDAVAARKNAEIALHGVWRRMP